MGTGENTGENTGSSTGSSGSSLARPNAVTITDFGSATTSTLTLTWTYNDSYTMDATYVYLLQGGVQQGVYTKLGTATSHTFTGLTDNTNYGAYVVTEQGERVSDASDISYTYTTALPGTGFTPLVQRDFESGLVGEYAVGSDAFTGRAPYPDNVRYSNEQAKPNGSQSSKFLFDADVPSLDQGAYLTLPQAIGKGEFWVQVSVWFPTGYTFVENTEGQKFIRCNLNIDGVGTGGGWDYYIGNDGMYFAAGVAQLNFYSQCVWPYDMCRAMGDSPPYIANAWNTYEFYVKLDEGNQGILRGWVNGTLVGEMTNLKTMVNASDTFHELKVFSGPQGGGPGVYPKDDYCYVDNIVIATSDSPPPNRDANNNTMIGDWSGTT